MDVFGLQKRLLLGVIKSFLGRFFKGIHESQLDEPVYDMSSWGMKFRLTNLLLNNDLFNDEVLADTPFRLIDGTISEISGIVSVKQRDDRALEMTGICLTLLLLPESERPGAARRRNGNVADGGEASMYSSLVTGDFNRHQIGELLADQPNAGAAGAAGIAQERLEDIDSGIDALATTVKGIIHSLRGTIRELTIRLRVPMGPPQGEGDDAVQDYAELILDLRGEIKLLDETVPESYGNSFRKSITFSGLRMCVCERRVPVSQAANTNSDASENEDIRVSLSDAIASGDVNSVENAIVVEYMDVDRRVAHATPTWRVKFQVKQLHAVVSPKHIARLSIIVAALQSLTAGEEETPAGNSSGGGPAPAAAASGGRDDAAAQKSLFQVLVDDASVSILSADNDRAVREAWEKFPLHSFQRTLVEPHYALRMCAVFFQLKSGVYPTTEEQDVQYQLFRAFPGRHWSLRSSFVELVERQPNAEPLPLLKLSSSEDGASRFPLRIMSRTTCPLRPDQARAHRVTGLRAVYADDDRVVCDDTMVSFRNISFHVDAETLDRVLSFISKTHGAWFCRTWHPAGEASSGDDDGAPRRHDSLDALMDDLGETEAFRANDPQVLESADRTYREAQRRENRSATSGPARGGGATLASQRLHALHTSSVYVESCVALMSFPVSHKPNLDVYGPIIQRLFSELSARQATATAGSSIDNSYERTLDMMYLSKKLQVDVTNLHLYIPAEEDTIVVGNVDEIRCVLVDPFEGQSCELCTARFVRQEPQLCDWNTLLQLDRGDETAESGEERPPRSSGGSPAPEAAAAIPHRNSFVFRMQSSTGESPLKSKPDGRRRQKDAHQKDDREEEEEPSWRRYWRILCSLKPSSLIREYLECEQGTQQGISMACLLQIAQLSASFHQDELLLLLFLVDQLTECALLALQTHAAFLETLTNGADANRSGRDDTSRSLGTSSARFYDCWSHEQTKEDFRQQNPFFASITSRRPSSSSPVASHTSRSSREGSSTGRSAGGSSSSLFGSVGLAAPSNEPSSRFWCYVRVAQARVRILAPRLTTAGKPVGEPCYTLLPLSERFGADDATLTDCMYHHYILEAQNAVVLALTDSTSVSTYLRTHLRLERLTVCEDLCVLPNGMFRSPATNGATPPWGSVSILLRSYNDVYNQSHSVAAPQRRMTLLFRMEKQRNLPQFSESSNISLALDRCSMCHQAAHDGDHWLFVLMNFLADAPIATPTVTTTSTTTDEGAGVDEGGARDHANDNGAAAAPLNTQRFPTESVVCPAHCVTHVEVTSGDFLVQYQPLGRECRVLFLLPNMSIRVGPITTSSPDVHVQLALDKAQLFVHRCYPADVLEPRHQAFRERGGGDVWSPVGGGGSGSHFGVTRRGVAADLEALGFVQVLCAASLDPRTENVDVRIGSVPGKPVFVHVKNLKAELACAYDSFYYFQLCQSHFGIGADLAFIPPPYLYAAAFSPRFDLSAAQIVAATASSSRAARATTSSADGEPLVNILVSNLSERVAALLSASLPVPAPRSGRAPPASPAGPSVAPVAPAYPPPALGNVDAQQPTAPAPLTDAGNEFDVLPGRHGDLHGTAGPGGVAHPTLDDFVDASSELSALQHEEVQNQRVPVAQFNSRHLPAEVLQELCHGAGITAISRAHHFCIATQAATSEATTYADGRAILGPNPLRNCPPIAVEVLITDCHADAKLYGGRDCSTLGFQAMGEELEEFVLESDSGGSGSGRPSSNSADDLRHHRPRPPFKISLASHPPGRNTQECVALRLHDVFVQLDLFEPGRDKAMQLIVLVRDVEVIDEIDASPLQTLVMCAIPRQLRDDHGWMFELKWTTRTPLTSSGSVGRPEEDLSIAVQPLIVAVHRRVVDLLLLFVDTPQLDAPPSTMYFRKFTLQPLRLKLNVYFEVANYAQLLQGQPSELVNLLPSLENSQVRLPRLTLESFPVCDFAVKFMDALQSATGFDNVILLLCGLQPIRTLSEASSAAAGLVLQPLEHYRKSKNFYRGIMKGLNNFTSRVAAEALRVAGGTTRYTHETLHAMTSSVQQQPLLSRGAQPSGLAEGLARGTADLVDGLRGSRDIVRYCLSEDGSIAQLPLAAIAPVNGVMKFLTNVFLGARNAVRPEDKWWEEKLFKRNRR